jgi:hypothetical protein
MEVIGAADDDIDPEAPVEHEFDARRMLSAVSVGGGMGRRSVSRVLVTGRQDGGHGGYQAAEYEDPALHRALREVGGSVVTMRQID